MKKALIRREHLGLLGLISYLRTSALPLSLFASLSFFAAAQARADQKNVLILSGGRGRVSINQMEAALKAHFSGQVNFSIVDLDNPRFEQQSYQDNLAEALRAGYAKEKLDLIVAVMTTSLRFAVKYRDKMFPGAPIVFMSNISPLPEKIWPGVTGVASVTGAKETIDLALRLHPDARAVAVIGEIKGAEGDWAESEHTELLRYGDRVRVIDLIGSGSPELMKEVAELPPNTVVLFHLYPHDSNQPAFGAMDVLAAVAQRFPTYSLLPQVIVGHGGIAGASYDPPTDAALAGQLGARVLSGERPDNIPVIQNTRVDVYADSRELRRWNIPESALPPGTIILNRDPTLWESGRKYFLVGIAVILFQAISILALFWQRTRKRRAQAELSASEEKFSKTFRHSPLVLVISRTNDSCIIDVNESFEQQLGWNRAEVIGRTPAELRLWADAEQRAEFASQIEANGSVRDLEALIRAKNGEIRTFLISSEVLEVAGQHCTLSAAADITERKQAEEILSTLSRRLIEAQEKERSRIARELHDDINQRLALLAVKLSSLNMGIPVSDSSIRRSVDEVHQEVSDLGKDVQALSHRLHSSKLEYLGLATAAGSFCKEFAARNNVEVRFDSQNIPRNLPMEISVPLFRVLQEALQNAMKYSGVRRFEAKLSGTSKEIHLTVRDEGIGFDPESTMNRNGLGLISMAERLKIVDGHFSIDSKPHYGTTIHARVPLTVDAGSDVKVRAATA